MNKVNYYVNICIVALCLLAGGCNNDGSKEEKKDTVKKDRIIQEPVKTNNATDSSLSLKAKFVNYNLGDASHFIFIDEQGKEWDFADSEDSNVRFAMELPAEKANEHNQGFTSNKELIGKWFTIRYDYKMQPQYQDGPISKVRVIIEAVLVK